MSCSWKCSLCGGSRKSHNSCWGKARQAQALRRLPEEGNVAGEPTEVQRGQGSHRYTLSCHLVWPWQLPQALPDLLHFRRPWGDWEGSYPGRTPTFAHGIPPLKTDFRGKKIAKPVPHTEPPLSSVAFRKVDMLKRKLQRWRAGSLLQREVRVC